ncbi:hypothetical protein [Motiliproteus sp. SC1-56]|uniref:hypothetical protein n=1 Tax=Motiliproteus sp. SC1-56 TaxID=2799565 RepID=UPI001A8D1B14|nr:hypothetical protein [Motiliproteus sp. SC1-56]
MKLINRSALLVLPRQPYVDWVNGLETDISGLEAPLSLEAHRAEGRVYLVTEGGENADVAAQLDRLWRRIWDNELGAWDEFGDAWPAPSRALFERWFEVAPQLICFDLADEPLLVAQMES